MPDTGQDIFENTEEQEDYLDDAVADKIDRQEIKKRNKSYTDILERYYLYIKKKKEQLYIDVQLLYCLYLLLY